MNREQAKAIIKQAIPCTDYLERSKNNMYCCPNCGSGHGANGTGAVKYYPEGNTWYCHACETGGDVIDAYTATIGGDYNAALQQLAIRAGITIERPTAADDFRAATEKSPQRSAAHEEGRTDASGRRITAKQYHYCRHQ